MRRLRPYLLQGDASDTNILKRAEYCKRLGITLIVNVGHNGNLPPKAYAVHMQMEDRAGVEANDWDRVWDALMLAEGELRRGGVVYVGCDAGLNRSNVFAGMLIAIHEHRPFDDALRREVAVIDDLEFRELWDAAGQMMAWLWAPCPWDEP